MGEIITPESLRISAVGRDLPEEELNLFHAGFEEERMILAEQDTLAEGGVKFASKLIFEALDKVKNTAFSFLV